jgi:hypothetical protein
MNRFSFVAGAAAAFLVAAGGSVLQSAPVAPAAADKTRGMALMSATVAGGPTLIRGSGAVSVSSSATGFVDVVFDRDISDCSCTASPGAYVVGETSSGNTASANCPYASNSVRVTLMSAFGGFTSASFHVIVFCPK